MLIYKCFRLIIHKHTSCKIVLMSMAQNTCLIISHRIFLYIQISGNIPIKTLKVLNISKLQDNFYIYIDVNFICLWYTWGKNVLLQIQPTKNWVNIGSGNGLVQSGNKPLPEPMLSQICHHSHWVSLGHKELTHFWGWVTHICVSKLTIIASDNGLSPGRRQAII